MNTAEWSEIKLWRCLKQHEVTGFETLKCVKWKKLPKTKLSPKPDRLGKETFQITIFKDTTMSQLSLVTQWTLLKFLGVWYGSVTKCEISKLHDLICCTTSFQQIIQSHLDSVIQWTPYINQKQNLEMQKITQCHQHTGDYLNYLAYLSSRTNENILSGSEVVFWSTQILGGEKNPEHFHAKHAV